MGHPQHDELKASHPPMLDSVDVADAWITGATAASRSLWISLLWQSLLAVGLKYVNQAKFLQKAYTPRNVVRLGFYEFERAAIAAFSVPFVGASSP